MSKNKQVPHDKCIDNTLTLLREGYLFIKNRTDRYQTNVFETRLLGKKVICISGKEAAKLFYNAELFKRKGALPKRVQKTLFGKNGVQTLDGETHAKRKMFFMSLLDQSQQERLTIITTKKWQETIHHWQSKKKVVLFDEAKMILCKAVCEWAGVPLLQSEVKKRANDFSTMIYALGAVGPKYWEGKRARARAEKWIKGLIDDTRAGKIRVERDSPLYKVAFYKELDGKQLNAGMAAIELINILRPITAISIFITFSALALYEHGECKKKLLLSNDNNLEMFAQEVRRYYPLTPFVGAIVQKNFIWKKCKFKKGTLVLLDVYGMNHDARIWENPYEFRPKRFSNREESLYDFIPQGGGNPANGHRCPGEGITIELMKVSLDYLINKLEYKVPRQNLNYSLSKIPTLPKSGFIISDIKLKNRTVAK